MLLSDSDDGRIGKRVISSSLVIRPMMSRVIAPECAIVYMRVCHSLQMMSHRLYAGMSFTSKQESLTSHKESSFICGYVIHLKTGVAHFT